MRRLDALPDLRGPATAELALPLPGLPFLLDGLEGSWLLLLFQSSSGSAQDSACLTRPKICSNHLFLTISGTGSGAAQSWITN